MSPFNHLSQKHFPHQNIPVTGSVCAFVGKAVTTDTRRPQFESSHHQIIYIKFHKYILKKEKERKRDVEWPILKNVPVKISKNCCRILNPKNLINPPTTNLRRKLTLKFDDCEAWILIGTLSFEARMKFSLFFNCNNLIQNTREERWKIYED